MRRLLFRQLSIGFFLCLLLLSPDTLTGDCGYLPNFYGYRFLDPGIASFDREYALFFASFDEIYEEYFEDQDAIQMRDNLEEWHERYCQGVAIADLQALIYGRSENRLQQLLAIIRRPDSRLVDLSPNLRTNSFARHLLKHRCEEVVEYLIFAKACEPLVGTNRNRFGAQSADVNAMRRLIETGRSLFINVKSHYIRLRYAYQIIRLAHYLNDFDQVLSQYEFLMPKVDADPSLIYYWIKGHYAAALLHTGERVRAAYIYSRIFEECPSKRESAYLSFSINSDEEWKELLLLCKNDHERANLYILRAQGKNARLVEEMRSIYTLEPKNRALELLLVREMQKLEMDFMGTDFNPRKQSNLAIGIPRSGAKERLINLQQFVIEVVRDNKVTRPKLWQLAAGFLELVAGDYFYAQQTFANLLPQVKNDTLRQQLDIYQQVLGVLSLEALDDSTERRYFRLLTDEELYATYPDFRKLVNDKFREVYSKSGKSGKAYLMTYGLDALKRNLDIRLINELKQIAVDTNRNGYDRRLLLERAGEEALYDLIDMEATYYLQRGQVRAAYQIFREIPSTNWDNYGNYTPFIPRLNDRVNFRISDTLRPYNKGEMMARMLELEEEAGTATDNDEAARKYFAVGLAFYNMSYFGYNWRAADYFRSGTSANRVKQSANSDFVFTDYNDGPLGNFENMSMERAYYFFERARTRADDPEIAARATYWCAKTERNQFYTTGQPGGRRPFGYFKILADHYSSTEYYERVIEECKTFAW
ncbi:MAG: hypothetical protein AAFU03_08840 [Bacteroidota bacterium]